MSRRVKREELPSNQDNQALVMTQEHLRSLLSPLRMFAIVRTPDHTDAKGNPELVTYVEAHAVQHDKGALYFEETVVELADAFGHYGYNRRTRYGAAPGTWVDFHEAELHPNAS